MYWLDYSAAKLTGATIKAAGYTGVIRYIDAPNLLSTKHTNLDEYRSHLAAGLTVRLVHQGTTTDADSGFQGGVNRATRAKAGADMLGYGGVIFFTNDRTTVPNVAAWQAYLDGAASVLGRERVGAYGFNNALNAAVGHASAFWQAGRKSDLVPHANFWQDNNTQVTVGGITCDRNLVISDYSPVTQAPTPTTAKKSNPEDRMATLAPTTGKRINITLPVPTDARGKAKGLVISQGWVSSYFHVVKFIGATPASGSNIVKIVFENTGSGPFQVGAARPWEIDVPAGAVSVELEYEMTVADSVGREVSGSAVFV